MHLPLAMRSIHWMHSLHSAPILSIVLGGVLLFFGRKLFWLFVGALGFVAGLEAGRQFLHGTPHATLFLGAIILGLIGVALAIFIQKFAIGLAGFVAGSYFTQVLLNTTVTHIHQAGHFHQFAWMVILAGGLIGLVLMLAVFEWALIVLSSFLGAHLLVHSVHFLALYSAIAFTGLAVVGILAQAGYRIQKGGKG